MRKPAFAAIAALVGTMVTSASFAQTTAMCAGLAGAASWAEDREAVTAAPKNHRVIYETADLRVLEVTVLPGEREASHHHRWPSVMVVDSRPPYVNYDKDGKVFQSVVQGAAISRTPADGPAAGSSRARDREHRQQALSRHPHRIQAALRAVMRAWLSRTYSAGVGLVTA